jgi:hypothetical protein
MAVDCHMLSFTFVVNNNWLYFRDKNDMESVKILVTQKGGWWAVVKPLLCLI